MRRSETAANRIPVYEAISSLLIKKIGIHELLVTGVMKMMKNESGMNHAARRSHDWNTVRGTSARIRAIGKKYIAKKNSGFVKVKVIECNHVP